MMILIYKTNLLKKDKNIISQFNIIKKRKSRNLVPKEKVKNKTINTKKELQKLLTNKK